MLRVRFNDGKASCNAEFRWANETTVQLNGTIPKNTSGFKVYRLNDIFLGDYSEFTVIIAELDNGLQFGKRKD